MKKILFTITVITFFSFFTDSALATATPTPTNTNSTVKEKLDQQINQLKEKIASRVSELNLVEKRGMIGIVAEVKGNQITLTDMEGNTRFADVDELTKFSSAGAKGFGLSDLTKGTKISILGNYNKQSKRILARFISTYTSPLLYTGTITELNAKQFQITITTADQKTVNVDINTSTKVSSYTSAEGLARYGFSKLAIGDKVFVAGNPDKTTPTLVAATRVIDFITLPKDQSLVNITPTLPVVTPTTVPTAAGNRRINPVR